MSPHDRLLGIHVLTPIAQASFDVTGISGNVGEHVLISQISAYMHNLVAAAEVLPYPVFTFLETFQLYRLHEKSYETRQS